MARYAEMSGTQVTNVALADQATATARGWLGPVPSYVGPGWTTSDGGQTWTSGTLPVPPEQANQQALRDQATTALANLRTIRDAPPVNVTSLAQAQTVCRQLQTATQAEAATLIRLARLLLGLYDAAD